MKIVTSQRCGFQPIKLMVTIETRDEFLNLWARLNTPIRDVESACFRQNWGPEVMGAVQDDSNQLFFALDQYNKEPSND